MSHHRWAILALLIVVVFFAISAPLLVVSFNERIANQTQLAVICTSARANISQLEALREISDQLGVPTDFVIPRLPPECAT